MDLQLCRRFLNACVGRHSKIVSCSSVGKSSKDWDVPSIFYVVVTSTIFENMKRKKFKTTLKGSLAIDFGYN
ncbi:hypothetical protein KC360_g174 [Hortaea werneckii]|nr:hypothetical protein KC344_g178 [Hortaea werneckii]KAI7180577.1 hypothetical protein KC360_g174 [Hortaea werneckii]